MGLHVRVVGAEKALRPLDRQLLHDVGVFAAAVPALVRVTLRVLVGQAGALRFHHRAAGEILRRDQLDVIVLARVFTLHRRKDLGIGLRQRGLGEGIVRLRQVGENRFGVHGCVRGVIERSADKGGVDPDIEDFLEPLAADLQRSQAE
jgi:hypothetical protein